MKKEKKVIIGIVLILIAGWFYWFQVRPANIRSSCIKQLPGGFLSVGLSDEELENKYKRCIRARGLK